MSSEISIELIFPKKGEDLSLKPVIFHSEFALIRFGFLIWGQKMVQYYNVNGQLVPKDQAVIHVSDLAFLRGYGIFDFFLFQRGYPLFVEDYLARFFRSARLMHLDPAIDKEGLKARILELIDANGASEGGIRLLLTGGYAEDGYTPRQNNLLIMQYPKPSYPESYYRSGVKLISHAYQRELPEAKTINYLTGIRLLDKIKAAGATEVLYHDGTQLRESVRANIFLVMEDGKLVTPARRILQGITRKKTLELARNQYEVEERDVMIEEVWQAREAFLTSSTRHIMPIVDIDGRTIGNGKPGELTQALAKSFQDYIKAYLDAALVTR